MGYIYKIWNELNDNIYVGQTTQTLESRWKEHIYACNNINHKHSYLYNAMRKYGKQYFHIEKIEQCNDIQLDEREKYWISYYDSYNNGYNMTIGGQDGRLTLTEKDTKIIQDLWDNGLSVADIVNQTNYSRTQVRSRLEGYKNYKEEAYERGMQSTQQAKYKQISQWDLQGNFIATYNSELEAEEKTGISHKAISLAVVGKSKTSGNYIWTYGTTPPIIEKKKQIYQYDLKGNLIATYSSKSDASRITGIDASSIGKVCRGERKTCGGFKWVEA